MTMDEQGRIDAARARLPALRPLLARRPHPRAKGLRLVDYVDWLLEHGGRQGRMRAAEIIERCDEAVSAREN